MMKQILSAIVLTVPICAAVPQMASAQSLNRSDFISSDETKEEKEYKLNVEGLGTDYRGVGERGFHYPGAASPLTGAFVPRSVFDR